MERLDALVIEIDEGEIVELLQQEVARIVIDAGALVAADRIDEPLEGRSVVNILAGMYLVADVAARLVDMRRGSDASDVRVPRRPFRPDRPGAAATDT